MSAWTSDELEKIAAADELEIGKYHRYAAGIVDSIVSPQARATTLKLVPR